MTGEEKEEKIVSSHYFAHPVPFYLGWVRRATSSGEGRNSRHLDFVFLLHLQKDGFRLTIFLDLHVHAPSLVCGETVGTWEVETWTGIGWWDEWLLIGRKDPADPALGHITINLENILPSPPWIWWIQDAGFPTSSPIFLFKNIKMKVTCPLLLTGQSKNFINIYGLWNTEGVRRKEPYKQICL